MSAESEVRELVERYMDLDESGTQVTTMNCNDVESLIMRLTELVESSK